MLTRFEEDDGLEAAALGPVGRQLPEPAHDLHHRLDLHVRDPVLRGRRELRLPRRDDLCASKLSLLHVVFIVKILVGFLP